MTRALALFLFITLTINFQSCENNLKLLNREIAEINKEVEKEEAQAKKDAAEKVDEHAYTLPEGMTEYTVEAINLNFAFPRKWKLLVYSEKRKNIDIEFQIPGTDVKAFLRAEASPGLQEITAWKNGRYTHLITKLSEFETKQDNAELIRMEGNLTPDEELIVVLFYKYNIVVEFSLIGKEPEFRRYRPAFDELIKSVRFKRRYDVDV